MSEHFVIKNIRRSIKEAQSRKGMLVGLPEIRIAVSHAEALLGEIDRLTAQLAEAEKLKAPLMNVPAAYENGRKQAAQEIIEEVIGDWNCDCGYGGLVIADAIKAKFGLEG